MTPTPKAASVVAGAQRLKTPLENGTEPSQNMVATLTTRGVSHQHPPGVLEKVSLATGVSESDLATMTISNATPALYHAISEYCALSPAQVSKYQPLHVSSDDPYEPTSLSDIESEDREAAKLLRQRLAAISRMGRHSSLMPGKGSGKKRAPVPKYKLGLGHVSITWPPPPNLTAAAIRREKKKERAAKRRKLNEKNIKEDLPPLEDDGSLNDVDQDAKTEENSTEPVSPEEQSEIHVIHYVIGDPCLDNRGRFTTHSVFLLATAEGPQALQRFTKEVIKWRIDKDHRDGGLGKYALHRFKSDGCGSGYWKDEGLKHARTPESVVLREGTLEAILDDIKNFLDPATKSWYIRHGLPHRRSLLFYGPPGTGKTSTIGVMASTFGLNCCFLSMTDSKFSNQMLADALSLIPPNALLVLEDVDSLFGEDRKNEQGVCVTFSGLLNALDGVISAEGVITVMTTNLIDKLDKALIRGGRVDRRFHFPTPTIDQIQRLFLTFYPKAGKEMAKKFAERIFARPEGNEGRSISTVQQLFIHHRADPAEKCLEGIDEYYDQHFPNGTGSKNTLYT